MFKFILGFSAFSLASCSAFFSVKGIALLFFGSFWSVAVMACCLEIAKLASTSYLYRHWQNINKLLRIYMVFATASLMLITSLGIFGFLSDAFQRNFSKYSLNISKIQTLKSKQIFILSQIDFDKNKLKDLIQLQGKYQSSLDSAIKQDIIVTKTSDGGLFSSQKKEKIVDSRLLEGRNKTVEISQQNIQNLFNQTQNITSDIQSLEEKSYQNAQEIIVLETDNTKGEIGTFKFVAEAFGFEIETAVKIFITLIVIVFDPLAISLVIAFNSLKNEKRSIYSDPIEKVKHIYHEYKRGTKINHNSDLADPFLKSNQTKA